MPEPKKNPSSVSELVDQLVLLEKQNAALKQKNAILVEKHSQMKGIAVGLLTRATKSNTFTNVQVKSWGNQILAVLNTEKKPQDFRR